MTKYNTILLIITGLSVVATWIAVYFAFKARRKHPQIRAMIIDPDRPTFQNNGEANILLIERIIQIDNLSTEDTPVFIDIWTESLMPLPPKIDTALTYQYRKNDLVNGYYGKYINIGVPIFMGRTSMLIHVWAKYSNFEHNDYVMFEKVDIRTNQGDTPIIDETNPEWYKKYNKTIPHGSHMPYIKE